jgi:ubiquitin C-terminal hydrolase
VYNYPDELIIHLKRFHSGKIRKLGNRLIQWGGNKLSVMIDCPFEMQLLDEQGKQTHYQLKSVINHIGSSGGGHYTANVLQHN